MNGAQQIDAWVTKHDRRCLHVSNHISKYTLRFYSEKMFSSLVSYICIIRRQNINFEIEFFYLMKYTTQKNDFKYTIIGYVYIYLF